MGLPVLSVDYDDKETLLTMLHALQSLERLSDDIFSTIQERIEREARQVKGLQARVEAAAAVVDRIPERAGKGITIIATSKYPHDEDGIRDSMYCREGRTVETTSHLRNRVGKKTAATMARARDGHFSEQAHMLSTYFKEEAADSAFLPSGLGSFPENVQHVGNAVLFNRHENPYSSYTVQWENVAEQHHEEEEEELSPVKLADAPVSMVDGDMLPEIGQYDVSFKPRMKDMAQFSLPSNLDLPDIADINFRTEDEAPSIAPSVVQSSLPELPSVFDFAAPAIQEPSSTIESVRFDEQVTASGTSPASDSMLQAEEVEPRRAPSAGEGRWATPPATAPLPQAAVRGSKSRPLSSTPIRSDVAPTAAPIAHQEEERSEESQASSAPKAAVPPRQAPMVDLLSAIRDKDNMVKLKSTAEAKRREESESRPVEASAHKPLSLAEEMQLKLARRQKILSGRQDKEEQQQARIALNARSVQAVGKFQQSRGNSSGPFSLDNMSGLDELLQAKDASSSSDMDEDSDWD